MAMRFAAALWVCQDWGDIAPEKGTRQQMNQLNHPAISLYDNAMLIIAMESSATLAAAAGEASTAAKWRTTVRGKRLLWELVYTENAIILPRQARDKLRKR